MPSYNISMQDYSPMIVYSGDWQMFGDLDEEEVPLVGNYSGSSYATTSMNGASLSLRFWGTAVYLEGAKRPSYGSFNVTLDGQTSTVNASRSRVVFQTTLYAVTDLKSEQHTLIVNCTGEPFDVDTVKVTAGDGVGSTTNEVTTLDDGDGAIVYLPTALEWSTTVAQQDDYYNHTVHQSRSYGAKVNITFTGNAIEVYGSVGREHRVFNVQIDSEDPISLNGTSTQYHQPSVPIFVAGGLESGSHTFLISNEGGGKFDIDKVVTSTWQGFSSSSGGSTSPSSSSPEPSHSRVGVIVGPIVGVLGFLAIIALAVFCLRRRRKTIAYMKPGRFSTELHEAGTRELKRGTIISPYTITNNRDRSAQQPLSESEGPSTSLSASSSSEQRTPIVGPIFRKSALPEPVQQAKSILSESSREPNSSATGPESRAQDVMHETDAGPAPESQYDEPFRLPPAYEQVTGRA